MFSSSRDWSKVKIFDIAAYMTLTKFTGRTLEELEGKDYFYSVIKRGQAYGVRKYLFVGDSIDDAVNCYYLSLKSPNDFYATIGVHPCKAREPLCGDVGTDQEKLDKYF